MINLFVTSDKKGTGKTYITAGIAATMQSLGYSVGYFKPVQTGAEIRSGFAVSRDAAFIKTIDPFVNTSVSYSLKEDLIPTLAAKEEGVEIRPQAIIQDYLKLMKKSEIILTEACNGILTPISPEINSLDIIKTIKMSVLIIAEFGSDVLENILLIVSTAKLHGLDVRGVILNKFIASSNENIKNLPSMIEQYAKVPILGIVPYITADILPSELIDTILHSVDLEGVFGMQIPKISSNSPE